MGIAGFRSDFEKAMGDADADEYFKAQNRRILDVLRTRLLCAWFVDAVYVDESAASSKTR